MGPARLERATSCSGGKRSIQLSYGPWGWEEKSRCPEGFAQRRDDRLCQASLRPSSLAQGIHVGRNGVQLGLVQVGPAHRRHDPGMLLGRGNAACNRLLDGTQTAISPEPFLIG